MNAPTKPLRVMFLCTGNSCRSQMAEGWAHHLLDDTFETCSAGTDPQGVNPFAIQAMNESGIDISENKSQGIDSCNPKTLDYVITVCGHANENCPVFLKQSKQTRILHHGFDDPPALAQGASSKEEKMIHYRRVRDEIKEFVEHLPALLNDLNKD